MKNVQPTLPEITLEEADIHCDITSEGLAGFAGRPNVTLTHKATSIQASCNEFHSRHANYKIAKRLLADRLQEYFLTAENHRVNEMYLLELKCRRFLENEFKKHQVNFIIKTLKMLGLFTLKETQ